MSFYRPLVILVIPRSPKTCIQNIATFKRFPSYSTFTFTFITQAMSRISGLRNNMNKRTFYKEQKINNKCFDFLSKQNIKVPLILDVDVSLVVVILSTRLAVILKFPYLCCYCVLITKHFN